MTGPFGGLLRGGGGATRATTIFITTQKFISIHVNLNCPKKKEYGLPLNNHEGLV